MPKSTRKKLHLNKETVRSLVFGPATDTVLVSEEPPICPTDGTKTCVLAPR